MKSSTQSYRWRHTTLTIRNTHDLPDRLDHLMRSFRKLRHRKTWKSTQFFGFYVVEITKSDSGWHPHLHVISYGKRIPWQFLLHDWKQITKDSQGVYIRGIKEGTAISSYVVKYILKPTVRTDADRNHVDEVTKNRRLFGPIGDAAVYLRNSKPPKVLVPCPKCGRCEWIPEYILYMWERQTQCVPGSSRPRPTIQQGRDP